MSEMNGAGPVEPGWQIIGVGIDAEPVARFDHPPVEIFTRDEIAFCQGQSRSSEAFAGTWCAKEAALKSLSHWARLSLRDVEVVRDDRGAPGIRLTPPPSSVAEAGTTPTVFVSLTYTEGLAAAVALALAPTSGDTRVTRPDESRR